MKLFIATHNDDEALWGTFTLIREKPLVVIVTDSWIQYLRGDIGCSSNERFQETLEAMRILDCPVIRLGVRDDIINEYQVTEKLNKFNGFEEVYAPAIQGGNAQHDLVGSIADKLFQNVKHYTAYTKTENYTTGGTEIRPNQKEINLKEKVLSCYVSQLSGFNKTYFEAVHGKSEWFI